MLPLKRFNPIVIARYLRMLAVPLAAFLLFTAVGLRTLQPPSPSRDPSGDDEFSVDRAIEHVREIASEPHPVGSPAHDRALIYLVEELRALPLEVELQDAVINNLRLTNVLARPKNPPGSNIVLLVAHYDSVPTGPGAGDDGAGVATLLETARLLSRQQPGKNEVAFLFTDGEEQRRLPGSAAFVSNNAAFLKRVRVVLNFEARGNSGPVTMFETGPNNLELIRLFRFVPYPVATSFAQDVYRHMPNDTDFSNFLRAGQIGYNFAVIMGAEAYHQPADNPLNLDLRSLTHYGSYATTLARKLSQTDLDSLRASQDAVFFPLFRGMLVVYPASWATPLAITACAIYIGLMIVGFRRRRLGIRKTLLGTLFAIALPALTVGAAVAVMKLITAAFKGHWMGLYASPSAANSITLTFLSITLIVVLVIKSWLGAKFGSAEMLAGALPIWLVLGVLTALKLTGFSYLVLWPALFGIAGLLLLTRTSLHPVARYGAMLCTLVPCCLLFAPTMLLAYHALGIRLVPALAGLAALQVFLIYVPESPALSTGRIGG